MERIHVSVRARPLSPEDAKTSPWRISGNSIFIPNHSSKFEFDRIFGEDCPTQEVYQARTKDIVAAAVRGFNGTVFAYGQTNSGKTHTMRGSAAEPGVIPLSVYDLFDTIEKEKDREFLLRMSYMEIYNEEINDLLVPEHLRLQIHENLERGIHVAGLQEEIVASPEQVLELMESGESHRHIGETNMNVYSSRSHTIFRMIIESRDIQQKRKTESGDKHEDEGGHTSCDAVRVSVLNLVDLAGSERAAKTGAEGVRLKEGSHINKSLMTLGTVIKKLSEGAESQGGHVPYRDSKLTRILQPALGGNSNTAIICNITLAQVHADETKSSLQFASRALRVTNHAHVNEILTDAALLKRQKKEIEELRAKLQGSHSEYLEEEILNLRNTLLQTELERERIALELEEEKKAHAERERRLQEQAKKIENLSTMVLYSSRDENRDNIKKGKRRDTWCPGALSRETLGEARPTIDVKGSAGKTASSRHEMGPLLPFDELVNEIEVGLDNSCKIEEDHDHGAQEDSIIPNPQSLMHVTSRRKASTRNKTVAEVNINPVEIHAAYDDLLIKFENQRIASEIQIDCLMRKLAEVDSSSNIRQTDDIISSRESEALLVIKQLQEQIKNLEMEKSMSQHNHNSVMQLTEEQNKSKFEEENEIDTVVKLSTDIGDLVMEVQNLKNFVEGIVSLVDDVFQSFSSMPDTFVDLKDFARETLLQHNVIISDYDKLQSCLKQKISQLESEKVQLHRHFDDLQKQIEDLKNDRHNSEKSLTALKEQQESEMLELLVQIQNLQKENSGLSSSALAKERETLRKDLEKTKLKLKETEFKLKNAVQEKTKLEGEKASAEREIKLLHGQKALLERDINKRESLAGRRRESVMIDSKRSRTQTVTVDQTMQEEYRQLEVLAFEMESTIASLEEELAAAKHENGDLTSKNESLASELEYQSEKIGLLNLELNKLHEEVEKLNLELQESNSYKQQMEISIIKMAEEKEELALQLSESLLEMEEEKAIWCSKERASLQALEEKAKLYNVEKASLSKEMEKVRKELQSWKENCNALGEELRCSEEDVEREKKCSEDKIVEIEQLKNDLRLAVSENEKQAQENLSDQLLSMTYDRDRLKMHCEELQRHVLELESSKRSYDNKLSEAEAQACKLAERISSMEVSMQNEKTEDSKEKAKLRIRLRWTQAKLDAFRHRYTEVLNDRELMDRKYEEASAKLKGRLAESAVEVLNLTKQLAAARGLRS
ncbi:kinesin-like protein KIN-7O isoform X2 [Punica granatum]|uniref:Kinesin-like protein KIN-7O isoform X2 n=1 Tax=Punica granatum TaxID=22663 RepID=A0A6P8E7M3_PUNGR|nr:kinesin-like protein KIN-7O isoform X2 [Punica granatum]